MYATKRKFQSILSSIANSASSTPSSSTQETRSVVSLPEDDIPQPKKRRLAVPVSRYPKPTSTIVSVNGQGTVTSSSSQATTQRLPNYAPWDRGQFLGRLKTFRHVDKWDAKPSKVNEVQWAKRGWQCVGKERVGCVGGCGREVVIKLEGKPRENVEGMNSEDISSDHEEDEWMAEADEQMVEKYADMIVTEHAETCLWRIRGCDETIQRLTLSSPSTALSDLRARYASLKTMPESIPKDLATPSSESLHIISRHGKLLVASAKTETSKAPSDAGNHSDGLNQEVFIMALFGWQAESGSTTGLATCSSCFRRLGLWLFTRTSYDEEERDTFIPRLDVIAEHRDYCPWINAASQSAGSSSTRQRLPSLGPQLAGWEVLLRVLRAQLRSIDESLITLDEAGVTHDVESRGGSVLEEDEDIDIREKKERERWARLRQLKRVFEVKKVAKPRAADSV